MLPVLPLHASVGCVGLSTWYTVCCTYSDVGSNKVQKLCYCTNVAIVFTFPPHIWTQISELSLADSLLFEGILRIIIDSLIFVPLHAALPTTIIRVRLEQGEKAC